MTESRYKLILANHLLLQEIEIPPGTGHMRIGTEVGCDIRLSKEMLFESFVLDVAAEGGEYVLRCPDNVFLDVPGDARKLFFLKPAHGTEAVLRAMRGGHMLLRLTWVIDFDWREKRYGYEISVPDGCRFTVGASAADSIRLCSPYITDDRLEIRAESGRLAADIRCSSYGVCLNGIRQDTSAVIIRKGDFFSLAEYSFYYDGRALFTDMNGGITVRGLASVDHENGQFLRYPCFQRNTRVKTKPDLSPVEILDPPDLPEPPKDRLLMTVLPAVCMLVLTVVIRGMFSSMGGAFAIISACSIGIGILTGILSFFSGRKEYRLALQMREQKYRGYIAEKRKLLTAARVREKALLEYRYDNMDVLLNKVETFSGDLFDRVRSDEDFLEVRLGTGAVVSGKPVKIREPERFSVDDSLLQLPAELKREFRYLENAPVVLDLREAGAVGVTGQTAAIDGTVRNMVLDLAVRQHFDDLKIVFILSEDQQERYAWVRHLPHVRADGRMARHIACGRKSCTALFEGLYREFSAREEQQKKRCFPHMVIFVLTCGEFLRHPVSRFAAAAARLQLTFVFCAPERNRLPLWCSQILQAGPESGTVIPTENGSEIQAYAWTPVSEAAAARAVLRLAPVCSAEVSLESALERHISLFSVLGICEAGDLDLKTRWEASDVSRSLAVPLGIKSRGEKIFLDIHEKAHGPHGLVAGTTGSGKSELLQSYILSMATLYHPYEVGFLLIDFKGGGMANQFGDLPHLMGAVTNMDGRQIGRSLLSVRAELMKRQALFAEAEVNHIDGYIRKYRKGEARTPLPHLVIVVDEFAELKSAYPDFMKELISTARIGRSLGVHLILATQKPSGQVNEQIWSNSRFKICLKVQSPEDSKEVLKSPLAAEIAEPGRAYLQVGGNELFELFQSAYSGEREGERQASFSREDFVIRRVSFEGRRSVLYEQKSKKRDAPERTQLQAAAAYIVRYCREAGIDRLPPVCAPPLEERLPFPECPEKADSAGICAGIGMADDPEHQRTFRASLKLSEGGLAVIGAPRSGKTNLLQTVIRSLSVSCTPEEVNFYILDFGSMALRAFEGLPHIGGIVTSAEDEKFRSLFRMLDEEMGRRKEKLVSAGVTSFASYREAGHRDLPAIVLMVDGFAAVKELYLSEEDVLLPVCRDGGVLGISVILCSQQTAGLGYRYLACFSGRLALYCNETSEYPAFISSRLRPDSIPGRGILEIDREAWEIQIFQSFPGEREVDRAAAVRDFVQTAAGLYPGRHARRIPEIPDNVTERHLEEAYGTGCLRPGLLPLGLRYEDVSVKNLDLDSLGAAALSGGGDGRKAFLQTVMGYLGRRSSVYPSEVWIVDDIGRELAAFRQMDIVRGYTIHAADVCGFMERIWETASSRMARMTEGRLEDLQKEPLILLIIQNQDAPAEISGNPDILKKYREAAGRYRKMKTGMIFSNIENTAVSFNAPEVLRQLRDDRNIWYFGGLRNLKLFDLPVSVRRQYRKSSRPGDCYHFEGADIEKLRMVRPDTCGTNRYG